MLKNSFLFAFSLTSIVLSACSQDKPLQVQPGHTANEQIEFQITLEKKASDRTDLPTLAQGIWISDAKQTLFEANQAPSPALQQFLENGATKPITEQLQTLQPPPLFGLLAVNPETPRQWSFKASPGAKLSLGQALQNSPARFLAPTAGNIPLFDANNEPIAGDLTTQFSLWATTPEKPFIHRVESPVNSPALMQWLVIRIENNDSHTHTEDGHSH